MFESIVIGKGLFGAAAARHLSARSAGVAVIGPDEPPDPTTHEGVFASHYDQGRLQRHLSRDFVWASLSHRSQAEYEGLTRRSGVSFYQPVDSLHLVSGGQESVFLASVAETARRLGVAYTPVEGGRQLDAPLPMLRFPDGVRGYVEHHPAGYINPRDLIRAQLRVAEAQGAAVLRETVSSVRDRGDRVAVRTREGNAYEARKVLLAMGAYTSAFDALPRKLAMRVKSETIILARLPAREVERLRGMPSMIYEVNAPPVDTLYMLPPILYPDGEYYLKMGCNTAFDRYPSTADEMNRWVRSGDSDGAKEAMAAIMREVIPGLEATSFGTKRCLISYTADVWPYVDRVAERIFVATGGNGMGAKSSDAIGKLAAELVFRGEWADELDPTYFRAVFEGDEAAPTEWGSCGMAKPARARRPDAAQEAAQ
ncbi:MAG TPA: FAD-dependent oxidoreductase [Polyangiaceae bacterium]|nr:FAD-dependent oxidoreductase [Polyangiaceae bacterium]